MSETTAASDKIMERVAALLAVAEHPGTPGPEAETALRMANSLITKHAIDEALLRQSQTIGERRAITKVQIILGYGEFSPYLRTIFTVAAETLRVSVGSKSIIADGNRTTEFWAYGADEDVKWLEMLFNMIKLQFLLKLDPKWEESLGFDANIYNFKVAGFKWAEINRIAMDHGHESREGTDKAKVARYTFYGEVPEDAKLIAYADSETQEESRYDLFEIRKPNGFFHKLKNAYLRHAKAIGDEARVVTQSHEAYRLSFAEAFRSTMADRFYQMQRDAEAEMDSIPGAALAIRDMKGEADQALWEDFPELSPEEVAARIKAYKEQQEREAKAREEMLDAMTPEARQNFLEQEEAVKRRQAKADRAWEKKNTRYYSRDLSAHARGSAAAEAVDLSRKAGAANAATRRGEIG